MQEIQYEIHNRQLFESHYLVWVIGISYIIITNLVERRFVCTIIYISVAVSIGKI